MERFPQWLKRSFSRPVSALFIVFIAASYLLALAAPELMYVYGRSGAALPAPTRLFILAVTSLHLMNYPVVLLLALPLCFGLAFLNEAGTFKIGWLKEWLLTLLTGLALVFIALAVFLPIFGLGNLH